MPSAPAEAEPRPTRAGHTPPAPAQGPLRRCPTDQSPEARTAAVGGGAGPHPDRRSPHRGAAAPGRMLTSHRPGTLETRRPGAPMPGAGRAPPPPRAPSLFWHCGIQRAQPRVPGGPHPRAPRATWLSPAVGEGRRGRRGWGRPHLRHGRVTVAGGSRVPAGADRGRPREREPLGLARGRLIRHPRPGDQNGAMSSPTGQKQAAGGGSGRLPGPGGAEPPPGSSRGHPYRTAARRRAEGSGGRLRAAPHLCPEWVAAHGPGSAVSGRRWWRRG